MARRRYYPRRRYGLQLARELGEIRKQVKFLVDWKKREEKIKELRGPNLHITRYGRFF